VKVLLVGVCRSPEYDKGDTEPVFLSRLFDRWGVQHAVYSNAGVWPEPVQVTPDRLGTWVAETDPDVVHLAMHGDPQGLVLRWSHEPETRQRRPTAWLTPKDIASMEGWSGRLVLSGACESGLVLSNALLCSGATRVVATLEDVPWARLAYFFGDLYERLLDHPASLNAAVRDAATRYPELSSYRVYD